MWQNRSYRRPLAVLALAAAAAAGLAQEPASEPPPFVPLRGNLDDESPVLGTSAAFDLSGETEEHIWVEAGTPLYGQPALRSTILQQIDEPIPLPVVERTEGWVRVRYGSWKGWVALEGAPAAAPSAVLPGADPEKLNAARALLGETASQRRLGAFTLYTDYTDVGAEKLLGWLAKVAESLPAVYEQYLGVRPVLGEDEAVVLFAGEQQYVDYVRTHTDVGDLDSRGHAAGGLAVLHAELDHSALRQVLVHELMHLLNHSTLAPDLPPWIDEGLADAISYCRVDAGGRLILGTLDGTRRETYRLKLLAPADLRRVKHIQLRGPRSSLIGLVERWNQPDRPAVAVLFDLLWPEFTAPDKQQLLYPMSAFLIRYLLADDRSERTRGFRGFLQAIGRGEPADPEALLRRLDTTPAELEADFEIWLRRRAANLDPRS
ncbi:MAG: hypothetical protein GY856_03350 [bacterium]|nr:hypothetical protein [bacterium]